jgi:hypothetical protein
MKHIYYGMELTKIVYESYELKMIESEMDWRGKNYTREKLENAIERLKSGMDTYLLCESTTTTSWNTEIESRYRDVVLEVNDKVELMHGVGTITNRIYDPVTDTMRYYTNVVVKVHTPDNFDEKMKKAKEDALLYLETLYEKHFTPKKKTENVEKKGFWASLFK